MDIFSCDAAKRSRDAIRIESGITPGDDASMLSIVPCASQPDIDTCGSNMADTACARACAPSKRACAACSMGFWCSAVVSASGNVSACCAHNGAASTSNHPISQRLALFTKHLHMGFYNG